MNASDLKAYTIPGVDSMPDDIASPIHLASLEDKAILVDFDGGRLSSDGGLILLGDPDDQMGLTRDLASVLRDPRDPRRVNFTLHDLLKQRVLQITSGYADANDANTLRHDPIFKLLLGRLPESGTPLASQPTISRFENRVSRTELYRLARVFVDQFIASYERPPKVASSTSMTRRTRLMASKSRYATMAITGAIVFCRCMSMRASPDA